MISQQVYEEQRQKVLKFFEEAKIAPTEEEKKNIEVADFGLDDIDQTALQLSVFINTDRVCAKEMVLFAGQTCPEHRHPPINGQDGKEETFRCRAGEVYLYVEGEPTPNISGKVPTGSEEYYTVFHEIKLLPGEQYTIYPNTLHWFQGGPNGAIISEFSTHSDDDSDIFTDPRIKRAPEVK